MQIGITRKVVFYENGSWNHIIKNVNLYTYTIEYEKKGGFPTQEEAEKSYQEAEKVYRKQIDKVKKMTNMPYTFMEYLDHWYQDLYLPYLANKSKIEYFWVIYHIIFPKINRDIIIGMVNSQFINNLIESCKDYSKCAAATTYKTLHLILQSAKNDGYIKKDVFKNVNRYYSPPKKKVLYTKDQMKIFLKAAKSYHSIYLEVLLALFCGLRIGEIMGLRFSDFNETLHTVTIERQVTRDYIPKIVNEDGVKYTTTCHMSVKTPKTQNSYRTLKIPDFIFEELHIRKEENASIIQASQNYEWADFICLGKKGRIKCNSTYLEALDRITKKNNLPHINMHCLRHMCATILIEQGVPLEKISDILGHKNTSTTFDIYCGIMDENDSINNTIENLMDPAVTHSNVRKEGRLCI